MKNTIRGKSRFCVPTSFWASLLVSGAVVNCLPLQATPYPAKNRIDPLHEHEVPENVVTSAVPKEGASVEAAVNLPTGENVASVAELTLKQENSAPDKVQSFVVRPLTPTLKTDLAKVSAEAPTVDNVASVAKLTSKQENSKTDKVQSIETILTTPTLEANPAKVLAEAPIVSDVPSVDDNFSNPADMDSDGAMSQITNVTQLRDVSPGDWAYEALRSLVERYGCISGYPDKTFRGSRATSRYEFAAGLNACLQQVERLISSRTDGLANRKDLETLQRLVEEFKPELTRLGTRLDKLDGRTAQIEANQFSTTTKMFGVVNMFAANVFGDKKAVSPGQSQTEDLKSNPTFAHSTSLILNTSFTGKDLLQTILVAGNANRFGREITGTDMTAYNNNAFNTGNNLALGSVFYQFPIGDRLTGFISPGTSVAIDFFPKLNPAKSISAFGDRNPVYGLYDFVGGSSVVYKPSDLITFQAGYGNRSFSLSNPRDGLFQGRDIYGAQVTFTPNKALTAAFMYSHSYVAQAGPIINATMGTGSLFAQAPFGENTATKMDGFALQAIYRLSERLSLGSWVGYIKAKADSAGQVQGVNVAKGNEADIWNWAVTMALRDLGKKGSQFNFIFGTPPWVASNDVTSRSDRDRSYHIEASYSYPINPRISITPGFFVIVNPEHNRNNDPIWLGTIKTTFYF